jgi:hypothetical protein
LAGFPGKTSGSDPGPCGSTGSSTGYGLRGPFGSGPFGSFLGVGLFAIGIVGQVQLRTGTPLPQEGSG